uniref:F-box domain-containing protein n=1 Tax=Oryza punctata TaxID=4537 RepID=A0A0E0KHE4_ORYPU
MLAHTKRVLVASRGGDPGEHPHPLSDSYLSPTGTAFAWNLLPFVNPSFSSRSGRSSSLKFREVTVCLFPKSLGVQLNPHVPSWIRPCYDVTQLLSDDVLTDVLTRLAPRWLAASRCVCKAWCAVIDTRHLLRSDLLPLSLTGIYLNFHEILHSVFLSRHSSTRPVISGMFTDYTPIDNLVEDHCNGLLLLWSGIANPATRQWTPLPPSPPQAVWMKDFYRFDNYLVFDPTISTHYEIFKIPRVPHIGFDVVDPMVKSLQWPPSPCVLEVFSSRTRQWGERSFVRDGEAAGTIADMALAFLYHHFNGVYWHGALYVHCQVDFVMRISLSDNKYQVIKLPMNTEVCKYKTHSLGRSIRGVHYALIDNEHRLRVWFLNELYGQMTWELKHDKDLCFLLRCQKICIQNDGPWTLHNKNYFGDPSQNDNDYEAYKAHIVRKYCYEYDSASYKNQCEDIKKDVVVRVNKFEWDSDNDDIHDTGNPNEGRCHGFLSILGFHPYKKVIFLKQGRERGLAYHFNSSKV